jgi:catechol 2,3-dioxygenase-like lactoylglutathione lyase family enzyme
MEVNMSNHDDRPPVWIGHATLATRDLAGTHDFMTALGMRPIADGEQFAVLELRGGTHVVLLSSNSADAGPIPFDLMVDDIDAAHRELTEKFRDRGIEPSPIEPGKIHRSFTLTSPAGHVVTFNSSHVSDQPV